MLEQHEETTHLKQYSCAFQTLRMGVLSVLRMDGQVRVSLFTLTLPVCVSPKRTEGGSQLLQRRAPYAYKKAWLAYFWGSQEPPGQEGNLYWVCPGSGMEELITHPWCRKMQRLEHTGTLQG